MADLAALAVCGPTASGKSVIAARAAVALHGEIVNADSRQVYEGMRVGSAWPQAYVMGLVPHHGYGFVSPAERYSAGRFVLDAARTIAEITARGNAAILVGGTGLYLEALAGTMPLNREVADDEVRARVLAEAGTHPQDFLHTWLGALCADDAGRVPPGDRYRTLRALESVLARRGGGSSPDRPTARVRISAVVLNVARPILRERIRKRTEEMFALGLIEEAVAIRRRFGDAPALTGLGYAEALAFVDGFATRSEAVRAAIHRTVLYAKRQETWFRRMRDARIVDASDADAAVAAITDVARESTART